MLYFPFGVLCIVFVVDEHFQTAVFITGEFICVSKQMSRKAMKSPVGTHTPQQMLLSAGVSVTEVVFISVSPILVFVLFKYMCVRVCLANILMDSLKLLMASEMRNT